MTAFFRTSQLFLAAYAYKLFPVNPTKDVTKIRSVFENANIGRVLFLRHWNTAPSTTGIDFDRILSCEGRDQAKQSALKFGIHLNPFYPSVLVSPAPRTVESAKIFLSNSNAIANLIPIDV
jgi:hypothetical protein